MIFPPQTGKEFHHFRSKFLGSWISGLQGFIWIATIEDALSRLNANIHYSTRLLQNRTEQNCAIFTWPNPGDDSQQHKGQIRWNWISNCIFLNGMYGVCNWRLIQKLIQRVIPTSRMITFVISFSSNRIQMIWAKISRRFVP